MCISETSASLVVSVQIVVPIGLFSSIVPLPESDISVGIWLKVFSAHGDGVVHTSQSATVSVSTTSFLQILSPGLFTKRVFQDKSPFP